MSFKRSGNPPSSGNDAPNMSQELLPNRETDSELVELPGSANLPRSGPRSAAWGLPRNRESVDSPYAATQKAQASERRWKRRVGGLIAVVFLGWVAVGLLLSSDGPKMKVDSRSDYANGPQFKGERVSKGMSKAEVLRVLGKPDMVATRFSGGTTSEDWTYSTGGSRSCVTFGSGKVTDYLPLK